MMSSPTPMAKKGTPAAAASLSDCSMLAALRLPDSCPSVSSTTTFRGRGADFAACAPATTASYSAVEPTAWRPCSVAASACLSAVSGLGALTPSAKEMTMAPSLGSRLLTKLIAASSVRASGVARHAAARVHHQHDSQADVGVDGRLRADDRQGAAVVGRSEVGRREPADGGARRVVHADDGDYVRVGGGDDLRDVDGHGRLCAGRKSGHERREEPDRRKPLDESLHGRIP